MNTFNMHIYAADKPFYSGPCESLVVPSLDGTYGIWANHSNIIIAIIPGSLIYRLPGQQDEVVAVSHGLVRLKTMMCWCLWTHLNGWTKSTQTGPSVPPMQQERPCCKTRACRSSELLRLT